MELIVRQNSLIIVGLLVLAITLYLGWRLGGVKYAATISIVIAVLLVVLQSLLSTNTSPYRNVQAFNDSLRSGQPALLVFYSNY